MIPADVADTAARSRLITDLLTARPTASTQKLTDALSDYVPGQRFIATIQALLPNGTYRAMIAQRDITLALPFAAKPGDALELEVVDVHGKLALAVATGNKPEGGAENASVATRLTVAGRLIGELLAGLDREGGKRPQPAPLNNAQPVLGRPPEGGADLAPALKTALMKSGMFYEAHQARWVAGKLDTGTLLQEPQGRLSPAAHALLAAQPNAPATAQQAAASAKMAASATLVSTPPAQASSSPAAAAASAAASPATASSAAASSAAASSPVANAASTPAASSSSMPAAADSGAVRVGMNQMVAPALTNLVQQQLEALATNCYVWQGQVWPGQEMDWEIIEEDAEKGREENTAANWTTRLSLTLPSLGGVTATLRLSGGKNIEIALRTENDTARQRLAAANTPLREQFETAGLTLSAFSIARHAPDEPSAASV